MQRVFRNWRVALLVVLALVVTREGRAQGKDDQSAEWPAVRDRTFAMVWETVNKAYFDPTFGGVDWAGVKEKYQGRLEAIADKPALRVLLGQMLRELRKSHFSILPREMAVFTPAERVRIGTAGIDLASVDGAVTVLTVPAGTSDLEPGDVVLAANGLELAPLQAYLAGTELSPARAGFYLTHLVDSRLRGAVGSVVELRVRKRDGSERVVAVKVLAHEGDWSEPMGDFPSQPVECLTRTDPNGIVYLRFNVFTRQVMKTVRTALENVPKNGGLVIDLRGNPGGISIMASGISGWLSDHQFLLATMHMREGHFGMTVSPQARAFLGPVAILIDGGSGSTSEIMAAGLQEAGRARIFGETSAGAALPSNFQALPTGDLFQYAIADLQTPRGRLIEGNGVTPDEPVQRTRADLLAGRDPVLEAARVWLEHSRDRKETTP